LLQSSRRRATYLLRELYCPQVSLHRDPRVSSVVLHPFKPHDTLRQRWRMGRGGKTAESGGRVGRQLLAGDLDRPLHPHPRLSGALHCLAVRRRLDVRASEESPGSFILVALEPECVRGDVLVVRWAGRVARCIRRRASSGSVWRRATSINPRNVARPIQDSCWFGIWRLYRSSQGFLA
jgi:hypothetical protein